MRRFLRYTLLFSLIILALLGVGEIVVRRMPTSYSYKDGWLRGHGRDVATLVLGSSHTYYGIRPQELGDSVFNLANISQTPEYDLALLEQYLPMMPNLRRVILPISYFTYRDPKLEEMTPGLCVNYKVGMYLPLHSDWSKYNFTISDFAAYSGRLRGLLWHQQSNVCDSLGFGLGFDVEGRDARWQEKGAERAASLTQASPGRAVEVQATLEKLVRLCRSRGIECVLVTTPVWHTFRENMDTAQWNEAQRLSRRLAADYGLRYYSWFDSPLFTETDFHDSDHLTAPGAAKLTRLLKEKLQPPSR